MLHALIANPDDFTIHEKVVAYIRAQARRSHSGAHRARTEEWLGLADRLVAIRGDNRDLNQLREGWARQLAALRQ